MLRRIRPKINLWFLVALIMISLFFSWPVLAQKKGNLNLRSGLDDFLSGSEIGTQSIGIVVGRIVKGVLVVLGLVCLIIFIVAGFQWMTSGGNKEKIQAAQKSMSAAIIGLVIVIIAWAAIDFIIIALKNVTS